MIYYLIPARAGSKTLQYKNHVLVPLTLRQLNMHDRSRIILSTDDEWLVEQYKNTGITIHKRSPECASDTASMHSVVQEVINDIGLKPEDDIVVLYPTYAVRTKEDIGKVYSHFLTTLSPSVLCCYRSEVYPEMFIESETHGKYRRQDYKTRYVYSHYVAVVKSGRMSELDEQLRGTGTSYYPLPEKPRDIDRLEDLLCESSM